MPENTEISKDFYTFCQKAEAISEESFSLDELLRTLALLDPELVAKAQVDKKLFVKMGFCSYRFGRSLCLFSLFYALVRKNVHLFNTAPEPVLKAFNKLVDVFFSPSKAKRLYAKRKPKKKPLSRKRLTLQERFEMLSCFQDLQKRVQRAPIDIDTVEDEYDARIKRLHELQGRFKKISDTLSVLKLEVPACFAKNSHKQDAWQKCIDALKDFEKKTLDTFLDEAVFTAFLEEEKKRLIVLEQAVRPFERARELAPKITAFIDETKRVLPFLVKAYVEEFLLEVEALVLSSDVGMQEIVEIISTQREKLTALDKKVKEGLIDVRKRAYPYAEKRLSMGRIAFRDIQIKAENILTADFFDKLPKKRMLLDEVVVEINEVMQAFFEYQVEEVLKLIEVLKTRDKKMDEMQFFQKDYARLMGPLNRFKDLQEKKVALEKKLGTFTFTKEDFFQMPQEQIAGYIEERYKEKEAMLQKTQDDMRVIQNEALLLEKRTQDAKQTIRRRLFEIFSGISPYQDLQETYTNLRHRLNDELESAIKNFYEGRSSIEALTSECQDMAYEHDVVKLRNEISHRSARLKDIRDEAYKLYSSMQHYRRLLEIDPIVQQEKIYRDFILTSRKLKDVIVEIENPFEAFCEAKNKDEINYVFRSMWMKIEELQPKVDALIIEAKTRLKRKPEILQRAFLKMADSVEEVVKSFEERRPLLASNFEDVSLETIEQKIQELEHRYPFTKPFSFFMQIKDFKMRQELLMQAKDLHDQIETTISFAKAMQYIKTYEEEHVDVILEAFETAYMFQEEQSVDAEIRQEFLKHKKMLLHALALVTEEVFLDIGLLDMHALMDVDKTKLDKILRFAISKAKMYYDMPDFGLLSKCRALESVSKNIQDIEKRLDEWKKMDGEDHLEHLRALCHELFDVKIACAASLNNSIAKALVFIADLRSLSQTVQKWLEENRKKKSGFGAAPWIEECCEIRKTIELFEPDMYSSSEFRPLIDKVFEKIYSIIEIADFKAQGEDPLLLIEQKKEFEKHLQELDQIKQQEKKEMPFFYLPGYIRFFSNE